MNGAEWLNREAGQPLPAVDRNPSRTGSKQIRNNHIPLMTGNQRAWFNTKGLGLRLYFFVMDPVVIGRSHFADPASSAPGRSETQIAHR